MAVRIYREYRIKYYLNAKHFIVINGKQGASHPHTWEFVLNIRVARTSFVEFNVFEKAINSYLSPYQNTLLNDMIPFDEILPTLENMVDYFEGDFSRIIRKMGGVLTQIEAGEAPTHTYILRIDTTDEETEHEIMSSVADKVLDEIIKG